METIKIPRWVGIDENNIPKWFSKLFENPEGRFVGEGQYKYAPLFWNVIYPTTRCTRRCSFCRVYLVTDDKQDMDDKTFDRTIDWISEVYQQHKILHSGIIFLGGEPLLVTDRIKKMMEGVCAKTPMTGLLYTNGDLLDSVNWDDLNYVQLLTLHITDLSLKEIDRRIGLIQSHGHPAALIATLDESNFDRVNDILVYALENNISHKFSRNTHRGNDEEYLKAALKKLHELCDILELYKSKGYVIEADHFFNFFAPRINHKPIHGICGNGTFTVSPDGSTSICTSGLYRPEATFGTVWDKDSYAKSKPCAKQWEKWFNKEGYPEECFTCDIRNACGGGCVYARVINKNTVTGKDPFCQLYKEIFPRLEAVHTDRLC